MLTLILVFNILAIIFIIFALRQKKARVHALTRSLADVSDSVKKKIRDAEEEKKRLQAILESMVEGVVVIDTEQRILLLNDVLADKFGIEGRPSIGRFYWEVFRDPEINAMLEKGLQGHSSSRGEHTALLTDSIFEIQVSPVFSNSDFLGIVAVFHDMTKIKELERVRREFVANVSHELRTPLTSIMGFVETLKEGAIEDETNRIKFLQIIEEHTEKLHKLIGDLLVLSKLEAGKEDADQVNIPLNELTDKVCGLFERPLQSKGIQITTEFAPDASKINGEYKSFEQLFINLLDNAIKYNRDGGHIFIRSRSEGNKAVIEFEDTGIGIPSDDIPRIFERFYRVDKSRSRQTGGFGLGLSIAKHIVEKHSGRLEVESTEGKGSLFRVIFPAD